MTENKNYRTQTSTSERNKLHLVFPGIWLMFQDVEAYSFPPGGRFPPACWRSPIAGKAGWNIRTVARPFF